MNQAPAPDRDEIANFLAQDFEEAPEGFRHIQVPDLNTPLERQNFANQVNAELNNSDIIITGIVGHASIYFRNQNRLFSPRMPDGDGSRLMHWNPGPIAYQVNANNQFELWGEITPMILTCNF
ncbi:hypothetical protein PULV_a3933 [Pseudoalteromonas ulvae UL12]|nr:hypothetical protein [Pseudoalteromonas ulvae UL12]